MAPLLTSRRRANDFHDWLEEGAPRERAGLHADLLPAIEGLAAARDRAPEPSPDFLVALRARLLSEGVAAPCDGDDVLTLRARTSVRPDRRLAAAATALVMVGGGATMAAAAQNALPGEALYPIKRGIEALDRSRGDDTMRGLALLQQAGTRLDEVEALAESDDPLAASRIEGTLADFVEQSNAGSEAILADYRDGADGAAVTAVRDFAADSTDRLAALSETLSPLNLDSLTAAATLMRDLDVRATQLCPTCAGEGVVLPDFALAATEIARATTQLLTAQNAGLDNSHPVRVPKGTREVANTLAEQPMTGTPASTDSDGAGTSGQDQSTQTPQEPAGLVEELVRPLREVTGTGQTTSGDVDGIVESTEDAVETILPD